MVKQAIDKMVTSRGLDPQDFWDEWKQNSWERYGDEDEAGMPTKTEVKNWLGH